MKNIEISNEIRESVERAMEALKALEAAEAAEAMELNVSLITIPATCPTVKPPCNPMDYAVEIHKPHKKQTFKSIKNPFGVCIREGNQKMGKVMNVSLMPIVSCNKDVPCKHLCYDVKLSSFRSSIKKSRMQNWRIYKETPETYFAAIRYAVAKHSPSFFRWHVGGDIPCQSYLTEMVKIAKEFPGTKFLAMTKSKDLNILHDAENLTVLASQWGSYQWGNGAEVAKTDIRFKAEKKTRCINAAAGEFLCPTECDACGHKCWDLVPTETVIFDQH